MQHDLHSLGSAVKIVDTYTKRKDNAYDNEGNETKMKETRSL